MCAVGTAVKISAGFDSVPDDFAPAMVAFGSQNVNGTFEGIKVMRDAVHHNFQGLIIFISADFTLGHKISCYWRLEHVLGNRLSASISFKVYWPAAVGSGLAHWDRGGPGDSYQVERWDYPSGQGLLMIHIQHCNHPWHHLRNWHIQRARILLSPT